MTSLKQLANRIICALKGVKLLLISEVNARIHAVITGIVILTGLFLPLSSLDWAALSLSIGLVWTTEAINTAIEYHVDDTSPTHRKPAGNIKDLSAGAVLLAGISAIGTGIAVFGPHLANKFI
jgi:diacylglycerol kinase